MEEKMLEWPLNLVDGNFPLDLASGSPGTFESSRLNVLTLNKTPGIFNLLTAHQDRQFTAQRPFFFQDDRRAFFVSPEVQPAPWLLSQPNQVGSSRSPQSQPTISSRCRCAVRSSRRQRAI